MLYKLACCLSMAGLLATMPAVCRHTDHLPEIRQHLSYLDKLGRRSADHADLALSIVRWEIAPGRPRLLKGWYANGVLAMEVPLEKNQWHGQWQTWYSSGQRRDAGGFVHGVPDGLWQYWYPNGQLAAERHFSSSKWNGFTIAAQQANARRYFAHTAYIKQYGRQAATSEHHFSGPNGSTYHFPASRGMLHGAFANYYPNGQLQESGSFENGLRHGPWQQTDANGQKVQTGHYAQGKKHYAWKTLNKQAGLKHLEEYRHGKLIYQKQYPLSGP